MPPDNLVSAEQAAVIFHFFKQHPLFRWSDAKNDCEDRANAICMLLDAWKIPNVKAWVFGGWFLKQTTGWLIGNWNFHVAAALPFKDEEGRVSVLVLDPATVQQATPLPEWANLITKDPESYYVIRNGTDYIFNQGGITADNWYTRNRQNYKWTMQGLAGINGVSQTGKAQLVFAKRHIAHTEKRFRQLLANNPF